jgi:hypothetical protein
MSRPAQPQVDEDTYADTEGQAGVASGLRAVRFTCTL